MRSYTILRPATICLIASNMKYALVNGVKTTPEKGLKGQCQLCSADVVAKCGDIKVHH